MSFFPKNKYKEVLINMENRITISICGADYTFTAEESPAYMQRVAAVVDTKMGSFLESGRINRVDAAVLAAVNIADELLKEQASTENLRSQLKDYLDTANKAKSEASDLRREIFKLSQKLDKLEKEKEKEKAEKK